MNVYTSIVVDRRRCVDPRPHPGCWQSWRSTPSRCPNSSSSQPLRVGNNQVVARTPRDPCIQPLSMSLVVMPEWASVDKPDSRLVHQALRTRLCPVHWVRVVKRWCSTRRASTYLIRTDTMIEPRKITSAIMSHWRALLSRDGMDSTQLQDFAYASLNLNSTRVTYCSAFPSKFWPSDLLVFVVLSMFLLKVVQCQRVPWR